MTAPPAPGDASVDNPGVACDPARVHSSLTGTLLLQLEDRSQVGSARRAVTLIARRLGLDETGVGTSALAVTEVAKNLLQHAGGGELVLWWSPAGGVGPVLEVVALDRGPGMGEVARCFTDGYSTADTPGTGLGAVRRAATELDLYTRPGRGTVLWFRLGDRRRPGAPEDRFESGAVCTPYPGEDALGDGWAVVEDGDGLGVTLCDGLGHGALAAEASREALRWFCDHSGDPPETQLQAMHRVLRRTRGAAVAAARLGAGDGGLRFAGVGNVAGRVVSGDGSGRHLVSQPGTLGHTLGRLQPVTAGLAADDLLVLHSDGIRSRWSLDDYPGLAARHPAVVAGVLHRDFRRRRDDASVLAVGRRRRRSTPWAA